MFKRHLIKNVVSTSSLKIFGIGLGYVMYLLLSRLYGPEQLGRFFIALGVVTFVSRIAAVGLGNGLVKFIPTIYAHQGKEMVNGLILKSIAPTLIISPIIIGILIFKAQYISLTLFNDEGISPFIKVMSFAVFANAVITICCGCFTAIGMPKMSAFGEAIAFNGIFLLVMASCYLLFNIQTVYVVFVVSMYLSALGLVGYWIYTNGSTIKKSDLSYREIFAVSIPVMFAGMTHVINSWTDILVLGVYRDAAEVGIYGVATKIARLATVILVSVNTVVAAKMSLLWVRGEKEEFQNLVRRSTKLTVMLTIPVILFLIVFSETVLASFGKEFVQGKWTLIILLVGQLVNVASGAVSQIMCLTTLQKEYGRVILSAGIVNVVLNFALIPEWGMQGAAAASSITIVYLIVVELWLVYKKLGITTDIVSHIVMRRRR